VFLCAVGLWCKMWFKGVKLSKEGILIPGSALDRTKAAIEHTYDRAYNDVFERAYAQAQDPQSSACNIHMFFTSP
jgi:hypothetical protein